MTTILVQKTDFEKYPNTNYEYFIMVEKGHLSWQSIDLNTIDELQDLYDKIGILLKKEKENS